MANVLVWADIPVTDMERAIRFYGALLQAEFNVMPGSDGMVAVPPREMGPIAFDLAKGTSETPTDRGVTIYLDAGDGLAAMLARVESAGGQIQAPARDMGPMIGTLAFIIDSEGNRIGLRSPSAEKA